MTDVQTLIDRNLEFASSCDQGDLNILTRLRLLLRWPSSITPIVGRAASPALRLGRVWARPPAPARQRSKGLPLLTHRPAWPTTSTGSEALRTYRTNSSSLATSMTSLTASSAKLSPRPRYVEEHNHEASPLRAANQWRISNFGRLILAWA